ncbi:MAG: ATP-binding protein [Bacteroidales bacterium]|nr:ATP-binding protein [Bacteroidales bacterium]
MEYKHRIADGILEKKLRSKGAVLIEGPKWCGKTTTAEQQARSILYMDNPASFESNLQMAEIDPGILLEGDTPRLIDEWQLAPKLWDTMRFEVDHRHQVGQFILTGSAVPSDEESMKHSGTGRFSWLTMRPMSLYESGESNGKVSLSHLFESRENIVATNSLRIDDIAFLICRGGWPFACSLQGDAALAQAFDYVDAVIKKDVSRVDGTNRNITTTRLLMRSYARNQGSQATIGTIVADMMTNDENEIGIKTAGSYLDALRKIFVIEDSEAWNPNLRSKTAIRTANTRYFIDPSIGTAVLGLGPKDLINDLNTMGLFFETLCVRDLRIFADALDGQVFHYRDKSGLECDAVIHLRNGRYGLVEIKLGGDRLINEGASNLLALVDKINTDKMKEPSFLMVLTGTGDFAYRRKDGVYVVPIGCLKD